MIRVLISLLLICIMLTPLIGIAEISYVSISDMNEQKIERWTQTYATKWRTIDVDVQPNIPNVNKVPVLTVDFAFWNPNSSLLENGWYSNTYDNSAFSIGIGEPPVDTEAIVKNIHYKRIIGVSLQSPYNWETAYLPGSNMSLDDAFQVYQAIASTTDYNTSNNFLKDISLIYWIDEKEDPIPMSGYYDSWTRIGWLKEI
ncbi:MAG: hypothetical protein RSE58_07015 [Clostridia bacterium]